MIAVFTELERDFKELRLLPRGRFKRVSSTRDIRAVKFSGIICTYGWYRNRETEDAYIELIKHQPELA